MSLVALYHRWILAVGTDTGLPDTLLHVHAGLAILLAARVVGRRPLGSFVPFACVVVAEFANELLDWLSTGPRLADTLSDVINTLFWPFALSLAVRLRPLVRRVDAGESRA